ncbi:hypothetical protein DN051_42475 (plasmid) [Streptomyces cadmiisoli]|uniref:Uncharacterized protein n=1 Tax=Streptomyces cadmiisoli TaxID=2184053 RepID=A0A2Z4JF76_9ACTN|nr:hypothetical protein DN051_42475 [Streptomyces cadmiisoli]
MEAKRPQLRLDTSDEERARLGDAYNACLEAQGVPMATERAASAGAKQASPVQRLGPEYDDEFDACLVKLPLQPPETAPDTNPQYVCVGVGCTGGRVLSSVSATALAS